MARKKVTSKTESARAATSKSDDSTRFLTVFLKKGMIRGQFYINDTLEKAKGAAPIKSKEEETQKPNATSNGFAQLQEQIIERIGVYRSLDDIMIMLHETNAELQFAFSVRPILKRSAKMIHEDNERRVFEFDRVDARQIIAAIRKAGSGVAGVRELPKLVLIGLISEYDVFLHDLIRAGLTVKREVPGSIDRSISLNELIGFDSIKEAADSLVEKEIDSILHEDHREQLLAINKLFNIKITMDDLCVTNFLDICESVLNLRSANLRSAMSSKSTMNNLDKPSKRRWN